MPLLRKDTGKLEKRHGFFSRFLLKRIAVGALRSPKTGAKQREIFASGVSGRLPSPSDGPNVVLAACNDAYFHLFARSLIQSVERLGRKQPVHIHLLDPSEDVVRQAETLSRELKFVTLTFTLDNCSLADTLTHRQIYYTAARFLLAPLILKQGIERLLIIDVDAVMNKSPWPLLGSESETTNGGFIFRRGMRRPWYRVLASAVFFNGSKGSLRFSETLAQSLAAALARNPKYHVDQILPYYLCTFAPRYLADFSAMDIPGKMMGYDYEPDTAFWTVKGKSNIDRFMAEKEKLVESEPV